MSKTDDSSDQRNELETSAQAAPSDSAESPSERQPDVTSHETSRKVADRPHNWTIVLGFLSPTLAGVALLLSWRGLETSVQSLTISQQSLNISQRAYISFDLQDLKLDPKSKDVIVQQRSDDRHGKYKAHNITLSVKINNTGNTPATLSGNSFQAFQIGRKGYFGQHFYVEDTETLGALQGKRIAGRSAIDLTFRSIVLDEDVHGDDSDDLILQYAGVIRFKDVFGIEFGELWCAQFRPLIPSSKIGLSVVSISPEICSPVWEFAPSQVK
jgi:hypothetical protein